VKAFRGSGSIQEMDPPYIYRWRQESRQELYGGVPRERLGALGSIAVAMRAVRHARGAPPVRGQTSPQVGAEDRELWAETVRRGAVDRVGGAYTKAARTWRLKGWGIGKVLHELGYCEDHNLTLEYGVNLLLP
jgi:hypothetical protein